MIDIHCHILPGVDDGADTIATALKMAQQAVADGITTIIATPHYNLHWCVDRLRVLHHVALLQAELALHNIPLRILPGNEIRLDDPQDVLRAIERNVCCTLADQGRFVLLEQPWTDYAPDTLQVLATLRHKGIQPIIPHPERHRFLRERWELIEGMIDAGAWFQVTADSLLGLNGEEAQQCAYDLIDCGWAHILATDAHNTKRKPHLRAGMSLIAQRKGAQAIDALLQRTATIIDERVAPVVRDERRL